MRCIRIQKTITIVLVSIFLLLALITATSVVESKMNLGCDEEYDRIMLYAVQCYATEGKYPPNLEYLVHHYGMALREDYFDYFYDTFSSNLRPDIIVTEKITDDEEE